MGNRNPLDEMLEHMMEMDPNATVGRLDEDGKLIETMTVAEFARRVYEAQKEGNISMEGMPEDLKKSIRETVEAGINDTKAKKHKENLESIYNAGDELAGIAARFYQSLKRHRIPFFLRCKLVHSYIEQLIN